MVGTFAFCKTAEAEKRMNDGDVIQNIESELYYKKEEGNIYESDNYLHWLVVTTPFAAFPPHEDWRSVPNLHYYNDLKKSYPKTTLSYLVPFQSTIVREGSSKIDTTKKRWFIEREI